MADRIQIPFEKHVLPNGLEVVLHEDRSCPLVSVCVVYHVGSAREEPGKSGFAHLFEHLMFEGSKNVGAGEYFKKISEAGGTLNGSTSRDRTNYYATLPSQHLELALWLESDRMGFLLPAITQEKLDNQRDVVKNERRQNYENRPYAKALWPLSQALYPRHHPYHWLTIGSHEDLNAASLEDVRGFFQRWYGPNNATLAIGGDFDRAPALELVEKYFGAIPRGPEVRAPEPRRAVLAQPVRAFVEDEVQLPELTIAWPICERYAADEAPLQLLLSVLSANKSALIDKALTVDEVLATQVLAYLNEGEIGGEFRLSMRSAPGVTLDLLETRVRELLDGFANSGVDVRSLDRHKNRLESAILQSLETISTRTNLLAETNVFRGDPGQLAKEIDRVLAVAPADVQRVFEKYLHRRPAVYLSVVPRGRLELFATGRSARQVDAERLVARAACPPSPPVPPFRAPAIEHQTLHELPILRIPYQRLPLIAFELSVPGGHLREEFASLGTSMLTAEWVAEGTERLNTTELTEAWDAIGADFHVSSSDDEITFTLRTLRRHFAAAMQLFADVLLRPRLDLKDFERLRQQRLSALLMRGDHARSVADTVFRKLCYGNDTVAGFPKMGTVDSVRAIKGLELIEFRRRHVVTKEAKAAFVGDVEPGPFREAIGAWTNVWASTCPADAPHPVASAEPRDHEGLPIYLVDKPGAAQSEIRVGHAGIARNHPDYDRLMAVNYVLGGAFNSRINANLRENKGYTYGAFSRFSAGRQPGSFVVWCAVNTAVTADSVVEILRELRGLGEGITAAETDFARDALIQALGRRFESVANQLELLSDVAKYDLPDDFLERRVRSLRDMQKSDLDTLAARHIHPERAAILIVGDAARVRPEIEKVRAENGLGEILALDIDGKPVSFA